MTSYRLERAATSEDLARIAAQTIASHLDLALDQRDRAQIALSGGTTPARAYALLGQEHLPWERVDVFLGDERWVDPEDSSSNARMLRDTLMQSGPGARAAFHAVPTVSLPSPEASAEAFAQILQRVCPGEELLGFGVGAVVDNAGEAISLGVQNEVLARIGRDVTIVNKDHVDEADRPELGFYIRNGIVVVVKNATIADGTVI